MEPENILEIEDLEVRFYTYEGVVEALDGVNLKIRRGEILGLVGETGCGKSVTSLSVLLLVPPPGKLEAGKVFIDRMGKKIDLVEKGDSFLRTVRGKDIAMIFQEPRAYLNPVYTVKDQISEVMLVHRKAEFLQRAVETLEKRGVKKGEASLYRRMIKSPRSLGTRLAAKFSRKRHFKDELDKEVVRVLQSVEIADPVRVADMYPHELSGGMAQRVVIAMALSCNPAMLIADEPTTNLDVTVQAQILNLIRLLRNEYKSSILYITHDLGVVAEVCDRVAVMYAGNVVETAEVHELFKHPIHPYARALLESIPSPEKEFKSIPGIVPSLIKPPKGCRFNDRCRYAKEICRKEKPRFIEVREDHYAACFLYGGS
jgi:peptide/nickel transport system ATP-binding protein